MSILGPDPLRLKIASELSSNTGKTSRHPGQTLVGIVQKGSKKKRLKKVDRYFVRLARKQYPDQSFDEIRLIEERKERRFEITDRNLVSRDVSRSENILREISVNCTPSNPARCAVSGRWG